MSEITPEEQGVIDALTDNIAQTYAFLASERGLSWALTQVSLNILARQIKAAVVLDIPGGTAIHARNVFTELGDLNYADSKAPDTLPEDW